MYLVRFQKTELQVSSVSADKYGSRQSFSPEMEDEWQRVLRGAQHASTARVTAYFLTILPTPVWLQLQSPVLQSPLPFRESIHSPLKQCFFFFFKWTAFIVLLSKALYNECLLFTLIHPHTHTH